MSLLDAFGAAGNKPTPPAGVPGRTGGRFIFPPPTWAIAVGAVLITYVLFSKKLLPQPVARVVARIYFWPTMPFTLMSRWSNYWTALDETLFVGAAPLSILGHPKVLHALGVRGVINLCDEYAGPELQYDLLGISQLRLRTVDHTEPSLNYLWKGVEFIKNHKERNEKVLVHCKSGHGRSAAVAMAWLIANGGLKPSDAQAALLQRRKVRKGLYKQSNIASFVTRLNRERAAQSKSPNNNNADHSD